MAEKMETPVSLERNKKQTLILLKKIFAKRISVCFFNQFIFL